MNILFFLFLILFLAFLEATAVGLHLVLLAVIALGVWFSGMELFWLVFLSGLVLDLVKGKTLGVSSLEFLVLALIVSLYKNRFQAQKIWFLLPLTLICVVVNNFLSGEVFSVVKIVINTGLVLVFLPLIKFFIKEEDNRLRL